MLNNFMDEIFDSEYFSSVAEAVQFIIAMGSIIGLLLIIGGFIGFLVMGPFYRYRMFKPILVGFFLCTICGGMYYGVRFFHLQH